MQSCAVTSMEEPRLIAAACCLARQADILDSAAATSAVSAAVRLGHGSCLTALLARPDVPDALLLQPCEGEGEPLTPLMQAAQHAAGCKTCEALLARCADAQVTATTRTRIGWMPRGCHALTFAAFHGHATFIQILLQHSSAQQVTMVDGETGRNALMTAAQRGHAACVAELLRHSPASQLQQTGFWDEQNAVMLAALHGHPECLQQLLAATPQPGQLQAVLAVNSDDYNALMLAAGTGCERCCRLLLQYSAREQVTAVSPSGRHALLWAVEGGHNGCVAALLQHHPGAQVTLTDDHGTTALLAAVRRQDAQCVARLLAFEPGSQVLAQDPLTGAVPLAVAVGQNDTRCVRLLLAAHSPVAQVTAVGCSGRNAAMVAASQNHAGCLRLLLAHDPQAQASAVDGEGWTAAMRAASAGHVECLQLLALLPDSSQCQQLDLALTEACQAFTTASAASVATTASMAGPAASTGRTGLQLQNQDRAGSGGKEGAVSPCQVQAGRSSDWEQLCPWSCNCNAPTAAVQQRLQRCIDLLLCAGAKAAMQPGSAEYEAVWSAAQRVAARVVKQPGRLTDAVVSLALAVQGSASRKRG